MVLLRGNFIFNCQRNNSLKDAHAKEVIKISFHTAYIEKNGGTRLGLEIMEKTFALSICVYCVCRTNSYVFTEVVIERIPMHNFLGQTKSSRENRLEYFSCRIVPATLLNLVGCSNHCVAESLFLTG